MKVKFTITIFVIFFIASAFSSCNNPIGLGTKLNLAPPTVAIISPAFMENAGETLKITGTASDELEVAKLSVVVEYVAGTGTVEWKQEWQGDHGAWYSSPAEGSGTWSAPDENGSINWSVQMSLASAPDGEYLITAGVENSVKTTGVPQQRRVIVDKRPPIVSILSPVLEENTGNSDQYKLKDPSVLDRLRNQSIRIQYEVKDDFSLAQLYFQLADHEGNIYYNSDKKPVDQLNWSGETQITAEEISGAITNTDEKGTWLHLISYVTDSAGNSTAGDHDWLLWWPKSDTPWVEGIGHESDPQKFKVYPGSKIQGQAYDDDGVDHVSYEIFNKSSGESVAKGTAPYIALEGSSAPATFFNWTFDSPALCAEYWIDIVCVDTNNTSSDSERRYFYVYDKDAPSIDIDASQSSSIVLDSADGSFKITGVAGDGVEVKSLTLVWLNPNTILTSRENYQVSDHSVWNKENTSAGVDGEGNRIWEVPLGTNVQDTETGRWNKSFTQVINLFNDLHIDTAHFPLSAQTFILRVEGASGRALTFLHSLAGDIQPPTLSIDTITVKRNGVADKVYSRADLQDKYMEILEEEDEIYISGTWGDDSFSKWNNPAYMDSFTVSWKAERVGGEKLNADGSWTAGPLIITTALKDGGVVEAALQDYGRNKTVDTLSARVDTDIPSLMFISSEKSDRAYKAGEILTLFLAFNRPVTFTGTPYMELNVSGKKADYVSGNGTDRHSFTYTVADGDNVPMLEVNKVNGSWSASGQPVNMDITPQKKLSRSKNISIDTTPPTISKVDSRTDNGFYKENELIYLYLEFSEDVIIDGGAAGNLVLNTGKSVPADSMSRGKELRFSYTVAHDDNSSKLQADSFIPAVTIKDLAGNTLGNTTIHSNIAKEIVIDTNKPNPPTLSETGGTSFTISGGEAEALLEYSTSGGTEGSWIPCMPSVTLYGSPGTYSVVARQIDHAGNPSDASVPINIIIEVATPLLQSYSGDTALYGPDEEIEISLHLREAVHVTGTPRLKLNVIKTGGAIGYAEFDLGSNGTRELKFIYTVQDGDKANPLEIVSIEDLPGVEKLSRQLSSYAHIEIYTDVPTFEGHSFDQTASKLTLEFSTDISKGSGNIVLVQQNYIAPAVLTRDEYNLFGGDGRLGSFYEKGTNGTDVNGNPDLNEKYILKYEMVTSDEAVINALEAGNADKVIIPVVSEAVSEDVSDKRKLTIDLSGAKGYAFKVKGAEYAINFDRGIVIDKQGNGVTEKTDTTNLIEPSGVNKPFIRVNKEKATTNTSTNGPIAVQPRNAQFRIDCQTPGVTITYGIKTDSISVQNNFSSSDGPTLPVFGGMSATNATEEYGSNTEVPLLNSTDANTLNGYRIGIVAEVTGASEKTYEVANRSVIQFTDPPLELPLVQDFPHYDGKQTQLWLRGGDAKSGSNTTPGFPLSWSENDKSGIRLMSKGNGTSWYWISWEVSAVVYFHFIAGTTKNTDTDAQVADGPWDWAKSKSAWSYFYDHFKLHPGGSVQLSMSTRVQGQLEGAYEFPDLNLMPPINHR